MENSCFVAYANRCGEETVNGQTVAGYPGNSVICGPHGDLVVADRPEPALLLADCVPSEYGETHPLGTRCLKDLRP
jgi:predicted amidohydrolase